MGLLCIFVARKQSQFIRQAQDKFKFENSHYKLNTV